MYKYASIKPTTTIASRKFGIAPKKFQKIPRENCEAGGVNSFLTELPSNDGKSNLVTNFAKSLTSQNSGREDRSMLKNCSNVGRGQTPMTRRLRGRLMMNG